MKMKIIDLRERALRHWVRCEKCGLPLEKSRFKLHLGVCPSCGHYHRLTPQERVDYLFDPRSFHLEAFSPLWKEPMLASKEEAMKESIHQQKEAMVWGRGEIESQACVAVIMDFTAYGGSLGAAVGELFYRACDLCLKSGNPLLIVTASGGARVQEGTLALLQMAKTMVGMTLLKEAGIPSISLLCDPTCGGVTASFATAADFILAEPGALICFSGPRVVEQTTGVQLPADFSRAEKLYERGLVDCVVPRIRQRPVIGELLAFLRGKEVEGIDSEGKRGEEMARLYARDKPIFTQ